LRLGYRVIRIWSNDIIEYLDGVLQTLLSELENTPSPAPASDRKRGERDDRGDYSSFVRRRNRGAHAGRASVRNQGQRQDRPGPWRGTRMLAGAARAVLRRFAGGVSCRFKGIDNTAKNMLI